MIDSLNEVYSEYFKDTFNLLGLESYEKEDYSSGGASVKFRNDAFLLQITNDRGLIELELSTLFGAEEYRSIESYYSLIQLEASQHVSKSKRKSILGTRLDYNGQNSFLLENSDNLKQLLNQENYKDSLFRIDTLYQERLNM